MGEQVHKKQMREGVFYTRCKYTRYRVSTPELLSYLSKGLAYPKLSLIARIWGLQTDEAGFVTQSGDGWL